MKKTVSDIYGARAAEQQERYKALAERFLGIFPNQSKENLRFFSAPGRTEICGNHTDHNRGKVLAAAVNLDAICAAAPNDSGKITLHSKGYEEPFTVDINNLEMIPEEANTTLALIRGVCAGIVKSGGKVGGFDCAAESSVLVGSGLSSSAAIEVLICTVLDGLYGDGEMDPVKRAQIAQFAENNYFLKPSGLMDQAASSVGGLVYMDFENDQPDVRRIKADFASMGYSLVVVSTGSSHDDLTDEYASIPREMGQVAAFFGKSVLREVDESEFFASLPAIREIASERAVLRAMHFFSENKRVDELSSALGEGRSRDFLMGIVSSGESSWRYLQNICTGGASQPLALALALSEKLLKDRGAWRVHGGGFAGTILAFVPEDLLDAYTSRMDDIFGEGACSVLSVRDVGAVEVCGAAL
ncbi:MAG: galactokinase [Christensenellales bacterium]